MIKHGNSVHIHVLNKRHKLAKALLLLLELAEDDASRSLRVLCVCAGVLEKGWFASALRVCWSVREMMVCKCVCVGVSEKG